jgi:hypothetical protein
LKITCYPHPWSADTLNHNYQIRTETRIEITIPMNFFLPKNLSMSTIWMVSRKRSWFWMWQVKHIYILHQTKNHDFRTIVSFLLVHICWICNTIQKTFFSYISNAKKIFVGIIIQWKADTCLENSIFYFAFWTCRVCQLIKTSTIISIFLLRTFLFI